MPPERNVRSRLLLKAGKHVQPPNTVLVPRARKSFVVEVIMQMDAAQTSVVASPDKHESHAWCVLDSDLKQVMVGRAKHGLRVAKRDSHVGRTVMAGAENPDDFDLEFSSAKLKNGAAYTLVCQVYGVLGALEFVAVHEPKRAVKKKASAGKKTAKKKTAKRKTKK